MAVKNINFFEQHVEKIVLAVAVAGAGFLAYLALQPITIPTPSEIRARAGKDELGPNDLDNAVGKELAELESQQAKLPAPDAKPPNYTDAYKTLASGKALPADLLASSIATFGPKNLQPTAVDINPVGEQIQLATPDPVGAEYLHVEARQDQVPVVPIVAGAVPAGPNMVANTRTQNYVTIDGYVPIGKVQLQLLQDKYNEYSFRANVQRAQVYRIAVERSEQNPNGWSEWKPVPPTKASPAPTDINFGAMKDGDLASAMDTIDQDFKQIVMPDFYQDAQGNLLPAPIMGRPIPGAIADEMTKLQTEIDKAKAPTGFRTVTPVPTPGVPATAPAWPADVLTLKTMPVIPFTFYDDTVESNHTYRYRVEVKVVNPTYGWKWGLKNPKMKTEPFLSTGRVVTPKVTVRSELAFFLSPGLGSHNEISGLVFKQNNGKWYQGSFNVQPGQKISTIISLVDEMGKSIDGDTGFTLVDAVGNGNDVHVILKDPTGALVTRDTREDWANPDRTKLQGEAQKPGAAATATAPGEATTLVPPPVPVPPPGRGVLPPPSSPQTRTTTRGILVNPRTP
ncbi:MAG TPA: hypothetical protein VHM90_18190 [Phycisphaerae bacterium]|nr:hypothetical protein [Phycisphaerae bacterium]